jgi:Sel1 repeat
MRIIIHLCTFVQIFYNYWPPHHPLLLVLPVLSLFYCLSHYFVISNQQGIERDYERAAEAYLHARSQSNAQAMFNLGYMHEHGQGLPLDLHLAKRYYDQALEVDSAAKLPVTLALFSLWIRKNYAGTFVVRLFFEVFFLYSN